jgi:nucleotide-binding universal stress UspA family protein
MTGNPVAVAVDDSPESLEALRMAADETEIRRTTLRWHYPSTWGVPLDWPDEANPGEFVRGRLNTEVDAMLEKRKSAGKADISVTVEVIQGDTDAELRRAGAEATMLVLGARHRRRPATLLGSVAHDLAARPPCPVLIVPAPDADAT